MIDVQQIFEPSAFLPPLIGGALIGLGVAIMAVFNGRVAGVSGIVAGAFSSAREERGWRWAFIFGLFAAPFLYGFYDSAQRDPSALPSAGLLAAAGLLVGVGAGVGSGCTSGHGVCGLARGSLRSLAATGVFMTAAAVTVFIARHVAGG